MYDWQHENSVGVARFAKGELCFPHKVRWLFKKYCFMVVYNTVQELSGEPQGLENVHNSIYPTMQFKSLISTYVIRKRKSDFCWFSHLITDTYLASDGVPGPCWPRNISAANPICKGHRALGTPQYCRRASHENDCFFPMLSYGLFLLYIS